MTTDVILAPEARSDISESTAWYREHCVRAADDLLLTLGDTFSRIVTRPTTHAVIDAGSGARRSIAAQVPTPRYLPCQRGSIVVFAVVHRRGDEPAWREQL